MKHDETNKTLTRRALLGSGAAAGVGLTLAGTVQAAPQPVPETWDEEVDVVIVGTGFAGLAAAIEAIKAGATVALLEKMRTPGGNSIISGGVIAAAGSPLQAEEGIEDSVETMIEDMMKAGLHLNYPDHVRIIAEKSVETVQWTIDELGVEYRGLAHMGGHAVPRSYALAAASGSGIIVPQLNKLKELGVEPRTRTLMKHLLRDPDGRVKGVLVHEKYRDPDLDSGTPKTIKARKAVIMATGGFGADPSFRALQDPRLGGELDTTNHPGATAQALREALNAGCTLVQPSWIQLGPWTSPDERGFGYAPHFVQGVAASYGLWIDTQTGKRFVNELADRKTRADAILAAGNKCIAFADAEGYAKGTTGRPSDNMDKMKQAGVLMEYATLEEMAAAHDIPLDALKATIASFNQGIDSGSDIEWSRYLAENTGKIGTPPFYVVRLSPKIHHTMGGCATNTRAEALDVLSGEPIPGLFVVGEASGGIHGASRLGSCAYADCLTFGRIAGQNAAAMDSWN
ncbi:flavocytochrome c [Tropicibacter oceani]|uniref:Flavocytochrome c n=1 Tax=Tropicibacter oceani TaxID=3058420 RepID=A0ABY8QMY8_9RHOB|nr:flavocytochrome c [Tropicibacter oceani]WGW05989.1 flavocytochrome c [Tropicibacter oceani]